MRRWIITGNALQRESLLGAFSSGLPLPSGTEPQLVVGVKNALLRAERLVRLGDRVLTRLRVRRPSLFFMDEVRQRFHDEIAAIRLGETVRSL